MTRAEPRRYTICLLFTPDGQEVLLQRKDRTDFRGLLNGVGGKFEPGETAEQCALREIREETGVGDPRALTWLGMLSLPSDCNVETHDAPCELHFLAGICDKSVPRMQAGETERIGWYPVKYVRKQTALTLSDPVANPNKFAGNGDLQYFVRQAMLRLEFEQKLPPQKIPLSHDLALQWENDAHTYCLHVQTDTDPECPLNEPYEPMATLACWHPRHDIGNYAHTASRTPLDYLQSLVANNVANQVLLDAVLNNELYGIRAEQSSEDQNVLHVYLGDNTDEDNPDYEMPKDKAIEYLTDSLDESQCSQLLKDVAVLLPLWLYEHSGLTISCGERVWPYDDQFDSSRLGWAVCTKATVLENFPDIDPEDWRAVAERVIRSLVHEYDAYLRGEVYWVQLIDVTRADPSDPATYLPLTSCGGFIGDDVASAGIPENVGNGLAEALAEHRVRTGKAQSRSMHWYTFSFDGD